MNAKETDARGEDARLGDHQLDELIEMALAPLRADPEEIARFEAAAPNPPTLSSKAERRLRHAIRAKPPHRDGREKSRQQVGGTSLGTILRAGRERAGFKVSDVARRLHVQRDYLVKLEADDALPLALGSEKLCDLVSLLRLAPSAVVTALIAARGRAKESSAHAPLGRVNPRLGPVDRRRVLEEATLASASTHSDEWEAIITALKQLPGSDAPST